MVSWCNKVLQSVTLVMQHVSKGFALHSWLNFLPYARLFLIPRGIGSKYTVSLMNSSSQPTPFMTY